MTRNLLLAVALEGTGWHPASWREPAARPDEIFTPGYWLELVRTAEAGGVDFVTIDDSFGLQSSRFGAADDRVDQLRGRLDALLIASYLAPRTSRIGLVPTVTSTHTEPFHVATALQTLDHVSEGRAGWQPRISASPDDAALVGRRTVPALDLEAYRRGEGQAVVHELFDEAGEVVDAVRRVWDSWEDDAIIRDVDSGRFLDGEKVHYTDFEGRYVQIKGASITPRSPQGQPPVIALAHATVPYEFAAAHADAVCITPHSPEHLDEILGEVHHAEARLRPPSLPPLLVFADLVVLLEATAEDAAAALQHLDAQAGETLASDALVVASTPAALVERLREGQRLGLDGFRLRPARLPADLEAITRSVLPALEQAGLRPSAAGVDPTDPAHGTGAASPTLRDALGLERPANLFTTPPTAVPSPTARPAIRDPEVSA